MIKHQHEWRTPLSSSYALCERTCGIQQLVRNILEILPANMVEEFSVRDKHRKRQGLNWISTQLAKRAWQWEQKRRKFVYHAEMRNKLERPLPLKLARTDIRQIVRKQQIFVKCSDDRNRSSTKVLHISRQATAAEVCYEVYKLTGVNMASFNIRFAGKYLEMDTPICHYGIGPDSTIHMHLKGPKGGGRTDNSCVHAAQAEGGYSPEEHGEGDANEVYILVKSIDDPSFAEAAEALRQRPRNAVTLLLPESDQYLTLSISEGGLGLQPLQKMRLRAELERFLREGAWEAGAPTPGLTPASPDAPTSTTLSRMIKACPPRTTAVTSRTSQPTSSYITIVGNHATLDTTLLSFLEILQMQRVCKEWKGETHTFLTQLKSLSFQVTGALTNFTGKLNIRAIWSSVVRNLSVHLQTIDLRDTEAMGSDNAEAFIQHILESCPNVSSIDMSNCDATDTLWAIAALAYKAVHRLQQQRSSDEMKALEASAEDTVVDHLLEHWFPSNGASMFTETTSRMQSKGNFIQVPASQLPHPFLPFPLYLDTLLLQGSFDKL